MDLTSLDCFKESESAQVLLKPTPFIVSFNGPLANYTKGLFSRGSLDACADAVTRTLPKPIFDVNFKSWGKLSGIYYKTQEPYASLQINEEFTVTDLMDGLQLNGEPGDYLMTRSSGINFIVNQNDFEKNYIQAHLLNAYLNSQASLSAEVKSEILP
ncbi:hypothetical protein [Vibrio owensii]|uniref:hypothetical protein n=1 Tax=Vibrio owensii TaxID=696485 RepID=UPI003CC54C1A